MFSNRLVQIFVNWTRDFDTHCHHHARAPTGAHTLKQLERKDARGYPRQETLKIDYLSNTLIPDTLIPPTPITTVLLLGETIICRPNNLIMYQLFDSWRPIEAQILASLPSIIAAVLAAG